MVNTLPDRWATLDLPVLRRIAELIDVERAEEARPEGVANDLGIASDDAIRSMVALHDAGYVTGSRMDGLSGSYVMATDLTERGRRAVGIWPSGDNVDALVEALQQAAESTQNPEKKSALRRAARGIAEAGRDVMVDVLAQVITKSATG